MSLRMSEDGCCEGHLCDDCAMCRRGRCCRRDNPEYKLPELGDWDDVVYGTLGKLNEDGNKIECHICGGWYKNLSYHVGKSHDVTPEEYRAYFGFNRTASLASTVSLAIRSAISHRIMTKRKADGTYTDPGANLTSEQRSSRMQGKKHRLQTHIDPDVQEKRKHAATLGGQATAEKNKLPPNVKKANHREGIDRWRREHPEKVREYYRTYRRRKRDKQDRKG